MPLSRATFKALGVMNTVAVDEPDALEDALALVQDQIAEIDEVCSRFRPDSELSRANRAAGQTLVLHPLLEEALVAAIRAAEMTGGLVDPTVGKHVADAGYTVTFTAMPADGPPMNVEVQQKADWRAVELDAATHSLRVPAGVSLDLGASGKAWAADRAAAAVADAFGVAALVECGGDVAVRGRVPGEGWPVRVALDENAEEWQDVLMRDGGLATSGTTARRWRRGGVEVHDIIDPRTGLPATTQWAMVTVAARTCLEANAAATAALILGDEAPAWLNACRLPSRMVHVDGHVELAGGWSA